MTFGICDSSQKHGILLLHAIFIRLVAISIGVVVKPTSNISCSSERVGRSVLKNVSGDNIVSVTRL